MSLPEGLRAWAGAGLEFLFLPGGLAPEDTAAASVAISSEPAQSIAPSTTLAAAVPDWPAPWAGLASRVRTAPKVILTYAGLAEDLSGGANPAWRKQLQSILAYLGWTQGIALFWPLFFAQAAEPGGLFATDIFAQGVRHFSVRHVVCLGQAAAERARVLFPQDGPAAEVFIHEAPGPEALASLLPHELHRALAGLKALPLG